MTILVIGSAGFIGFHLIIKLLSKGETVIGIDNLNSYYDPLLKNSRLEKLKSFAKENNYNYFFEKLDISNLEGLKNIARDLILKELLILPRKQVLDIL